MLLKAFAEFRKAGALSQETALDAIKYSYATRSSAGAQGSSKLEELISMSRENIFRPYFAAIHVTLDETMWHSNG